jgi:hypothetical protein
MELIMSKEEDMGRIAERELFINFCYDMWGPGCEVEYHDYKYALYWDARVYFNDTWNFFQIKTGAPYVTQGAGVLHLHQQLNYNRWIDDPTIDDGEPDSKLYLISFPTEGPGRYNEKIRERWLGKAFCLKPDIMKEANSDMFRIQDENTQKARYIIPYKENYVCVGKNLHLLPENVEIYERLKSLSSSKF